MYLSRLILNPRSRQVQKELADPYQLHRTIMAAFPDVLPPDERVLFRVDLADGLPVLLVQSQHPPEWDCLDPPGERGYLRPTSLPNPAVKQVALALAAGQRLRFRLRANPTVKRAGKRVGLYRQEEQIDWLQRQGGRNGFALVDVWAQQEGKDKALIHGDDRIHRATLVAVRFDGVLAIRDPKLVADAAARGIGPAKGLGFGLLSLGPCGG
jgi:CRISPR system Cascade subunit CasE